MSWTDIAKRATGYCIPKSWLDTFIDNLTYLYNALGGSGGSALNIVPNSSFENDVDADGIPDQWTQTLYTGGSAALITTDSADAESCYKFTHPGGAGNGGGYLTSDYVTWSPYRMLGIVANLKCSVAGIKVIVRVKFYDKDKGFLSNADVYTSTANPTVWTLIYAKNIDTPVTARFAKLELHGGVNDTDVAGDVYFDFGQVVDAEPAAGIILLDESQIDQAEVSVSSSAFADVGSNQSITVPVGSKLLVIGTEISTAQTDNPVTVRWRIGANYSSEKTYTADTNYTMVWPVLDVSALTGAQTIRMQLKNDNNINLVYAKCPAANHKYCKTARIVVDVAAGTTTTDAS